MESAAQSCAEQGKAFFLALVRALYSARCAISYLKWNFDQSDVYILNLYSSFSSQTPLRDFCLALLGSINEGCNDDSLVSKISCLLNHFSLDFTVSNDNSHDHQYDQEFLED